MDNGESILPLNAKIDDDELVLDVLKKKLPGGKTPPPEALLTSDDTDDTQFYPVLFEHLDGVLLRQAALRTRGGAGPSALDAQGWRQICISFGTASDDLCNALALLAKRLCTEVVDFKNLQAYVACRLIPQNKRPGVCPIGICEVARRIIGKAILTVISKDIQQATGTLQLCAGQTAGIEAAIHAMHHIYDNKNTDALLLVDAENAFNLLNQSSLAQHQSTLPCLSKSTSEHILWRDTDI